MITYKVYFTFYNRKYKTEIESNHEPTKKEIWETLAQYLDIVKIEKQAQPFDDQNIMDFLRGFKK